MYRPQYGSKNKDDSRFCTICGQNLENIEERQTKRNLQCPECGCENIGKGILNHEASLMQYEFKFIPRSSDVLALCVQIADIYLSYE